MDLAIFSDHGFLFRWLHFFFGIIWIGMLYYFNFVHGAFMKEADGPVKPNVQTKLLPRALWWFRVGALWTLITGWSIITMKAVRDGAVLFTTSWGILILLGAVLGTIMFLNVWFVIWPNQKVVIASFEQQYKGGAALPEQAGAAARALTASRTNVMFSIPMLFFMGAASHLPLNVNPEANFKLLCGILVVIIGALEINALKGKNGPLETVKGVITAGFVLTGVLYAILEVIL